MQGAFNSQKKLPALFFSRFLVENSPKITIVRHTLAIFVNNAFAKKAF